MTCHNECVMTCHNECVMTCHNESVMTCHNECVMTGAGIRSSNRHNTCYGHTLGSDNFMTLQEYQICVQISEWIRLARFEKTLFR